MTTTTTTTTDAALAEEFFERLLRVEQIIHLATMAGESMPDEVREALTGDTGAQSALADVMGMSAAELADAWGDGDMDEIASDLAWKKAHGWLVCFATPVRRYRLGVEGAGFSWGHTYEKWVYADTYDEAIEKGRAWAAECDEADRARAS